MPRVTSETEPEDDALETSVRVAVEADIKSAIKANLVDQATDAAAIATTLGLADNVDYLIANGGLNVEGKFDNVSIPTLLRYLSALNLTPNGRAVNSGKAPAAKKSQPVAGKRATLAHLQAVAGGRA